MHCVQKRCGASRCICSAKLGLKIIREISNSGGFCFLTKNSAPVQSRSKAELQMQQANRGKQTNADKLIYQVA